jgi:uncharacterized protein YkwD
MAGLAPETIAQTVRCLQDQVRRQRGRSPLIAFPTLRRMGSAQARDMVAHSYFSHTSPSGRTFAIRVSESEFARGRWTVGENLGLSTGTGTPSQLVGKWMASPPHRRNLLDTGFRLVGVGIARAPSGWILSAVEFGARRHQPTTQ